MFTIKRKEQLNPHTYRLVVDAPRVARRAEPGQFIILRTDAGGERIPLTIADFDRDAGEVTVIFQVVGATTEKLRHMAAGDCLADFVGPLGKPTQTEGLTHVCVIGGGVGCAIAYPIAKKLHGAGCRVDTVIGFRGAELVLLENEFAAVSDHLYRVSDDGTWGEPGRVTDILSRLIGAGESYDRIITIGPLPMMKAVCGMAKEAGIPSVASMNPIMIDGTGMCGGCRLTVGGKTVFACVDGPEFDGAEIDFDTAMMRGNFYRDFERHRYEDTCRLFGEGDK